VQKPKALSHIVIIKLPKLDMKNPKRRGGGGVVGMGVYPTTSIIISTPPIVVSSGGFKNKKIKNINK